MARTVKIGVGLMEREVVMLSVRDFGSPEDWFEEFERRFVGVNNKDEFATVLLEFFARNGMPFGSSELRESRAGWPENSFEFLAYDWLVAHAQFERVWDEIARGKQSNYSLAQIADAAEEMGRIRERMWWRTTILPSDQVTPEKLALRGQKGAAGSRNSAHQTNQKYESSRNERMDRMTDLCRNMSVKSAACQCEVEGLGSWQAIRKQYYRWKARWEKE